MANGVHILYPDSSGHESNAPFVDVEKIQLEVAVGSDIEHSNAKATEVNEILDGYPESKVKGETESESDHVSFWETLNITNLN